LSTNPAAMAHALAEAARAIDVPHTMGERLDAIVHAARSSVPGFDHVGVSIVHRDGRIETLAGTDQLVWELDAVQYDLREGPCVQAIMEQRVVTVEHARQDQRWPRFMPIAVGKGLRAQLAVQLYNAQETLGGLNLYSTETETFGEEAVDMAELFATHAAIALGHARREDQLNQALLTRQVIGQAVGIISERYQISTDRAFHFLVRTASSGNIKLRTIAEELVGSSDERREKSP
jgi:GAF domain-containing protein